MLIQASLLGAASDPFHWQQFSCINTDGTLNKKKYAAFMRYFANNGANCTRELPFLVKDPHLTGNEKSSRNFLPFIFRNGKYDLEVPNPLFYDNLRAMIKIANRHNLAFQYSMFDRAHSLNMPDSPWNLNHQGKQGYYQWDQFTDHYVNQVLLTVREAESQLMEEGIICKMLFELENEPRESAFIPIAIETSKRIIAAHFEKEQIEDGVSYLLHKGGKPVIEKVNGQLIRNPLFEALKRAKRKVGLYPGEEERDKSRYFSTIHQVDKLIIRELIDALKHTRRFSISCDGEKPKPNSNQWFGRLLPLFQAAKGRPRREQLLKTWKVEHIYRGDLEGNSQLGDAMDGILGISQAWHHVFETLPENFGNFPQIVAEPPPEPVPIIEQIQRLNNRIDSIEQQVEVNTLQIQYIKKLINGKE